MAATTVKPQKPTHPAFSAIMPAGPAMNVRPTPAKDESNANCVAV